MITSGGPCEEKGKVGSEAMRRTKQERAVRAEGGEGVRQIECQDCRTSHAMATGRDESRCKPPPLLQVDDDFEL